MTRRTLGTGDRFTRGLGETRYYSKVTVEVTLYNIYTSPTFL